MSEKHFRMINARTTHRKEKKLCVVSFEFDCDCLNVAHLGLICPKLDAAFLELLLENGYQVSVEPPAPCKYEQNLFDEVGGV